jgi:hypothetical protein
MTKCDIELAKALLKIQRQDDEATNPDYGTERQSIHYDNRAFFLMEAISLAHQCGYKAGIRIDPDDLNWPVVFIELPTGQISYHIKQHSIPWDGHTTEQKCLRLLSHVASVIGAN